LLKKGGAAEQMGSSSGKERKGGQMERQRTARPETTFWDKRGLPAHPWDKLQKKKNIKKKEVKGMVMATFKHL